MMYLPSHVIDVLHVTPILRISVLKPEYVGSDPGRHTLGVVQRRRVGNRSSTAAEVASFNEDSERIG